MAMIMMVIVRIEKPPVAPEVSTPRPREIES
jgi:hypothetical protein